MNIGICLGDVAGIGPEVVVKALSSGRLERSAQYQIIGDQNVVAATCKRLGLRLKIPVIDCTKKENLADIPLGVVNVRAARAAARWLRYGVQLCQERRLAALVTAPVNKQGLRLAGLRWPGQTEWLAHLTRSRRFAMMLVGGNLRVTLVTTHLPLREVSKRLSRKKVLEAIELTATALPRLGMKTTRIGVAALNPHAGEGGLLGKEEETIIAPAVADAVSHGIIAVGPVPADALFHRAFLGEFDAVVAMYHDQGLGPLKMLAFHTGVNVTLGLPFVRTSPDHGTAYDIAGKGVANPQSMIEAINLASRLSA